MREWETRFESLVSDAADLWLSTATRYACSGLYPPFYLYYRSADKGDGALYMVPETDKPDSAWQLGDAEPYRANLNRDLVRRRIHSAARRLPILSA